MVVSSELQLLQFTTVAMGDRLKVPHNQMKKCGCCNKIIRVTNLKKLSSLIGDNDL